MIYAKGFQLYEHEGKYSISLDATDKCYTLDAGAIVQGLLHDSGEFGL